MVILSHFLSLQVKRRKPVRREDESGEKFFYGEETSVVRSPKMEVNFRPLSELRNNYWMIQKLGCGGFGKVYLIKNRESKDLGAAKHQKWTSSEVPKLVRREVVVLRKLLNQVNNNC